MGNNFRVPSIPSEQRPLALNTLPGVRGFHIMKANPDEFIGAVLQTGK